MLRQISVNQFWVGDISYVDTTAFGAEGPEQRIHEPAGDTISDRWYTITIGVQVGIFSSW